MTPPYSLGAKPDRYDPRDYKFLEHLDDLERMDPARVQAAIAADRKFYTMVNPDFRIDQGNEGTCVGHASTNVLLAGPSPHRDYVSFETEELAHQFARKLYLEASGDTTYQNGMYPRDACAKLLEWELIESYWKVLQVEDIVTALLTFGPVKVALPWYFSMFYRNDKLSKAYGNYYIRVSLESDLAGYHDIALTGIDMTPTSGSPPFFRVQNSWGEDWGANGTARLLVEDFRRLNLTDNWTFQEAAF